MTPEEQGIFLTHDAKARSATKRFQPHAFFCAALLSALTPQAADARLARIVVESREPAAYTAGGRTYEILKGTFYGELDPRAPQNAGITDISAAPRNAKQRVEYSATFAIARPVDPAQASGVLWYDVPNRGNYWVGPERDGHIRVASGWQGDIPPAPNMQTVTVPIARPQGHTILGPATVRFVNMPSGSKTLPLIGGLNRPVPRPAPATLDTNRAQFYRQSADGAPLTIIPSSDWAFADCDVIPFPGKPDPTKVCLRDGFDRKQAYTLVYQARDPLVLGIGFAATRDLISFLRHAQTDDAGTPNPVAGLAAYTIGTGTSQSGNYLRTFLHLGFNADEDGRIVFDGMNPNIGGRLVPLNMRFGMPSGALEMFEPGSEGTLWWGDYADVERGQPTASLLDRCRRQKACPKIVETFGSAEFWGLRMSPSMVGTDAKSDIPLPDNVRRYYLPSVTHGGGSGSFSVKGDGPLGGCKLPNNPLPVRETMNVALRALIDWVRGTAQPPKSVYPSLAAGDLVAPTPAAMKWRAIRGAPSPAGKLNPLWDFDFGPGFNAPDLSGAASTLPPRIRRILPSLVPRVNVDGNETSGVPSVQLLAPLGTYTGWNERVDEGYGANGRCLFMGGFIPFATTKAERLAAKDQRLSLEERYVDHAGFVAHVRSVVDRRIKAGWLLPEDGIRLIAAAEASDVLVSATPQVTTPGPKQ